MDLSSTLYNRHQPSYRAIGLYGADTGLGRRQPCAIRATAQPSKPEGGPDDRGRGARAGRGHDAGAGRGQTRGRGRAAGRGRSQDRQPHVRPPAVAGGRGRKLPTGGPSAPLSPPPPRPPAGEVEAELVWLAGAAARGPDLAARLLPFRAGLAPVDSLGGWARGGRPGADAAAEPLDPAHAPAEVSRQPAV